jgi:LEA14-like dessication related protein
MNRRTILIAGLLFILTGCAVFGLREPLRVSVADIEPLPGQGMEARFAVKLRIQNPNDTPLNFNGIALDLDLQGKRFASGVSDQSGVVTRFGEAVITVPVTVPATAVIRQAYGLATGDGDRTKIDYQLRGHFAGQGIGRTSFDSEGEIALPAGLSKRGP